ncbi:hypothetical protein LCGC14_1254130 [marine sediment metagenome]|uniref:Uncharacterized protein n=1 Tax=marine sediment metagenome TaxID=412755 RepID=A0A0F9LNV9_9ZZZZ
MSTSGKDIQRMTEVRLVTWLGEAIGDSIARFVFLKEIDQEDLARYQAELQGSESISPAYREMATKSAEKRVEEIARRKIALSQLWTLSESAEELRQSIIGFWESQEPPA